MEKTFKEEISVFYVAITRAKKNVFLTVNTGLNQWNYTKQTSCLIELPGLSHTDYDWENVICQIKDKDVSVTDLWLFWVISIKNNIDILFISCDNSLCRNIY